MALDWYDHELHRGIATYAREKHWILNTQMSRLKESPEGWTGDGVIGLFNAASPLTKHVTALRIPVVDIGGRFAHDFVQIKTDNEEVGRQAARHLLERGHSHLIFVHLQNSLLEVERSKGFREVVEAAGKSYVEWRFKPDRKERKSTPYGEVRQWFAQQLLSEKPPFAIFAQNDDASSILLAAAVESGFRVPEQVAVIGADNCEIICDFTVVPMSSVDSNVFEMGYQASRVLDNLMAGKKAPEDVVIVPPRGVVLRESTDFLAVRDPRVLKVLEYIRANFHKPLAVEELTQQVDMSRSSFYRLFRSEVHRSMAGELGRVRIEYAKKRLRETKRKIGEITDECGFGSIIIFSRAFQNSVGMSPSEYRASIQGPTRQP